MKLSRIGAAALCAALCLGTMSGCSSKTDGANEGGKPDGGEPDNSGTDNSRRNGGRRRGRKRREIYTEDFHNRRDR